METVTPAKETSLSRPLIKNRLSILYGSIPSSIVSHLILAMLFYIGLQTQLNTTAASVWIIALTSTQFVLFCLYRLSRNQTSIFFSSEELRLRYFRLVVMISGALWGVTPWLLLADQTVYLVFVAFVIAGINSAAINALAADKVSLAFFALSSILPLSAKFMFLGGVLPLVMDLMLLLLLIFVFVSWSKFREVLKSYEKLHSETLNHQQLLDKQNGLTQAIAKLQANFIQDSERRYSFDELAPSLLSLSGSEIAFVSEVHTEDLTQPSFKLITYADKQGHTQLEPHHINHEVTQEVNSILKRAVIHDKPSIYNDLLESTSDFGLPQNKENITTLILIPIIHKNQCLGLLGLANRPTGYDADSVTVMQPIIATLGQLFNTLRVQREHRLAQQELRRLSQVASQTVNGVIITDLNGQIEWVNDGMTRISGYTREELLGQKPGALLQGRETDPVSTDKMRESFENLQAFEVELVNYHKSGSPYWIRIQANPMYDDTGNIVSFMAIETDTTKEHEAREALKHNLAGLTVLNQISSLPVFEVNSQLSLALELAADYLAMDAGAIIEINNESLSVKWSFPLTGVGLLSESSLPMLKTFSDNTIQKGDIFSILDSHDFQADQQCQEHFKNQYSFIGIPISLGDKLFGTISFLSSPPRTEAFKENEKEFLRLFSRWVESTLKREQDRQRLQKLTSHIPGMVYQFQQWPDGRNCFPYASPGIKEIYGARPEEVQEDGSGVFDIVHPEDRDRVHDSISYSGETLTNWNEQYRTLRGGCINWLEGEATPEKMADGSTLWHGYIKDITAQKKSELAIAQNELRLRRLFELSPVGIALNDYETGTFIEANPAFVCLTGYSLNELSSMNYQDLTPEEYREQEQTQLNKLEKTGQYGPYEKQYITKSGQLVPVLLHGMKVEDASERTLIWSIIEDISDRKRVEKMKNEFIATVSHELRTPLTSISGALGLLVNNNGALPGETVDEMLSIAHKNSKRLKLLVDDLLDIEKLVDGKIGLHITELPVANLVQEALYNIQPFAESYDVSLRLVEIDKNLKVKTDHQRFLQVMNNLLSNAIKFSHRDSVVSVIIESNGRYVRVSVSDEGIGISPDFIPHIFEKFAQLDATDSRGKGGTGLGLAISHELVNQMDGMITFESVHGKGSTFRVDFPVANGTSAE